MNLVIVESPTKARTLSKFLGSKYKIEASMGHMRDLPKADLGVDVENNFEPKYIIPRDKKKRVNELKKVAEKAKTIWLASDPDREGEAIAWHIAYLLSGGKTKHEVKRVVFHEITEEAIKAAFEHPQELNLQLVDAQQARRVLDRLVGYKLSPLLWKKVKRGLSAGRVQSVALRLIVERERDIGKFIPVEYWSIEVELNSKENEKSQFLATLIELNGEKITVSSEQESDSHVENLKQASYEIAKVTKKEVRRYPSPPFITSTLQQTAGNKLMFTAKKTMMLAQNLYEHGLITYMRTDSVNLSSQALTAARAQIESQFGKSYLPSSPRVFKSKSKNAQEAHEAIRPTNMKLLGGEIAHKDGLTRDHGRLYELIRNRTLASQMSEAVMDQTTVDVLAIFGGDNRSQSSSSSLASGTLAGEETARSTQNYLLRASGSVIKFDGWLKLYGVKQVEEEEEGDEGLRKQVLPELKEQEGLNFIDIFPKQHFTEPPPRYTEASLIKKLEELGIGRPSTYAPILSTIQERFYVERQERKFFATALGIAVNDFLMKYFPDIFDYEFTASMEDQLDDISRGERQWKETIATFYAPFEKKLEGAMENAEKVKLEVEEVDKECPKCGKKLVVRTGRFGKFLACSGFPECKHTEGLEEKIESKCPNDGGDIVVRRTKKGKTFYGCKNWPTCKFASWTKPKSSQNSDTS